MADWSGGASVGRRAAGGHGRLREPSHRQEWNAPHIRPRCTPAQHRGRRFGDSPATTPSLTLLDLFSGDALAEALQKVPLQGLAGACAQIEPHDFRARGSQRPPAGTHGSDPRWKGVHVAYEHGDGAMAEGEAQVAGRHSKRRAGDDLARRRAAGADRGRGTASSARPRATRRRHATNRPPCPGPLAAPVPGRVARPREQRRRQLGVTSGLGHAFGRDVRSLPHQNGSGLAAARLMRGTAAGAERRVRVRLQSRPQRCTHRQRRRPRQRVASCGTVPGRLTSHTLPFGFAPPTLARHTHRPPFQPA